MITMKKLKLTHVEKRMIVEEIAERIKDAVFIRVDAVARQVLDAYLERLNELDPHTPIKITINAELLVEDILQILGRIRREKHGEGD